MKIYSIDENGFINEVKDVKSNYLIRENDFKGEPPHPTNHHHETGERKPLTQEQLQTNRMLELEKLIDRGQKVGDDVTVYQEELKTLYGETHDTYLQEKNQEAIDNYTLGLIEGGIL